VGEQGIAFRDRALGPALPAKSVGPRGSSLLTKREEGVVDLVAEGLTNRDISHQLNLVSTPFETICSGSSTKWELRIGWNLPFTPSIEEKAMISRCHWLP
jgi:hypothetical protein